MGIDKLHSQLFHLFPSIPTFNKIKLISVNESKKEVDWFLGVPLIIVYAPLAEKCVKFLAC